MKKLATRLHNRLVSEIELCKAKKLPADEEIERCFLIAKGYWKTLQERLEGYVFYTTEEEIYFFKDIKPLFTAEIEYYNLLYHTRLFQPQYDPVQVKAFWEREARRLQKFKEEQEEFYIYYKVGCTARDEDYFVRANNDFSNFIEAKVYDLNSDAATSGDQLVSGILALERYNAYVQEQLTRLEE